jgi:hypothetical protein
MRRETHGGFFSSEQLITYLTSPISILTAILSLLISHFLVMKLFLLLGAIVALLLGTSPAQAQKIIEKKAPLSGQQRLVLDLQQASSIRIKGGSGQQVLVKATVNINQNKLNDALLLTLNSEGDEVKVKSAFDKELLRSSQEANCPDGDGYSMWNDSGKNGSGGYRLCARIDYEIEVPTGATVKVNTISGNIEVTGLNGPLDAKSISGFVDVSWPSTKGADVALKTITGEVYTNQDIALNGQKNNSPVGYQVRGQLGSNGPTVKLESISGDVFFRKQN